MTNATPIFAADIQLAQDFCKENPHLFPAGLSSLKSQMRNRKYNGLTSSGAVVKRMGYLFIVKPNYLAWFAGRFGSEETRDCQHSCHKSAAENYS